MLWGCFVPAQWIRTHNLGVAGRVKVLHATDQAKGMIPLTRASSWVLMRGLCGYVMIGPLADHYDVSYVWTCWLCQAYDLRVHLGRGHSCCAGKSQQLTWFGTIVIVNSLDRDPSCVSDQLCWHPFSPLFLSSCGCVSFIQEMSVGTYRSIQDKADKCVSNKAEVKLSV